MTLKAYKAMDIANWFLAFAQIEELAIENLKLQKLLYFAQCHHLADYDIPLFEEEIEAWENGPVVSSVNKSLNKKIFEIVTLNDDFDFADFEPELNDFLITIWNTYGDKNMFHLRSKTHKEVPWDWYRDVSFKYSKEIIPKNVMKNYYLLRSMAV